MFKKHTKLLIRLLISADIKQRHEMYINILN